MSGKGLRGPAPSLADACQPAPETAWVYLLRCPDGSLYGGWTNDLARRLKAHRTGKGGAKYTKSHGGPAVRLAYAERCADKSAALKREAAIKKLPKAEKEALAAKWAADNRITIRMATPADGAAVAELYNWYVLHGTQTFQYRLSTAEEYAANIAGVLEKAPFLVAITRTAACRGLPAPTPGTAARPMPGMWRLPFIARRIASARGWASACTPPCWSCCGCRATITPLPS